MRLRLATAATTLALLLAHVAEPVAAHGLRSSSSSSSSDPASSSAAATAAAAKQAQTTPTPTTEKAPAAGAASPNAKPAPAAPAASGVASQQQQATEVDVAALPEGMVLGLMEADKRQGLAMAMATLHDAVVAGRQGQGGRKLFPSASPQDVFEIIRCLTSPGDGWSEIAATGHHACKVGVIYLSVMGALLLLAPVVVPINYGLEGMQAMSASIDGTEPPPTEYLGVEGVHAVSAGTDNPERPPVEGAYRTKDSDMFGGKEASSSTSDDEREEEYQRLVEMARQASEKAIGAFKKLAAARRLLKCVSGRYGKIKEDARLNKPEHAACVRAVHCRERGRKRGKARLFYFVAAARNARAGALDKGRAERRAEGRRKESEEETVRVYDREQTTRTGREGKKKTIHGASQPSYSPSLSSSFLVSLFFFLISPFLLLFSPLSVSYSFSLSPSCPSSFHLCSLLFHST